jgi:uncharacterized protein YdeI (YjbR/CyaY-like superfamily)
LADYLQEAPGVAHLPYADTVEEALCFGWIDSRPSKLDDARTMLLFTPRKPGSVWARTNKIRIADLTASGRMTPAGLAAVERAKRDGSWTSLDEVEDGILPPDLNAALDGAPAARKAFDSFTPSRQKRLLQWLAAAKRPETRVRRIEQIVSAAAEGRRANDPRPRPGAS